MLALVREINLLWEPVYPYLAKHIADVYHRSDGRVLEVGPFCGVIYDLAGNGIGNSFSIASFPSPMEIFYREEVLKRNMHHAIDVVSTTPELTGIDHNTADLIVFRGALFFPSFFRVDYGALLSVLKPGGTAFVGGGFGKYTPPAVIQPLADRSRELNYLIGKKETAVNDVRKDLEAAGIVKNIEIVVDGGLWILLRK